jgi:hypothetical protein
MIGKLLGLPFRVLNAPLHAAEKVLDTMCGGNSTPKEDRILTRPLDALAEAFEEIDGDKRS